MGVIYDYYACGSNNVPFPISNSNPVLLNLNESKSILNRITHYFHMEKSGSFYPTRFPNRDYSFLFWNSHVAENTSLALLLLKKEENVNSRILTFKFTFLRDVYYPQQRE